MSSPETALLKERLLEDWERIYAVVALASGQQTPWNRLGGELVLASPLPEESRLQIAKRWVWIFEEEIATVQLARNAVAHAKPISEDSLKEAVKIAEQLLSTLSQRLNNGTDMSAAAG